MTGSSSEVSRTSTLRRAMRRLRADMVAPSARADRGLEGRRSRGGRAAGAVSSDTDGLLLVLVVVLVLGFGPLGRVAGQGQEHVVEGGAVHGEPVDHPAGRVDLVEQGPDLSGAAVGGHPDGQPPRVALGGPAVQA